MSTENELFHQMMEEKFPTDERPLDKLLVVGEANTAAFRAEGLTENHEDRLTVPALPEATANELELDREEAGLSVDFWLKFPIRVRPLKLVPGRNRREKRMFRKLAGQQEAGTLTTSKRGGGNLAKLTRLYNELARAGVLKQSK